jgi:ubiquinone/menaquinone biosynthesis C-methylase UbiE
LTWRENPATINTMKDSVNKFTDKVENYIKFRPDYPSEFLHELKRYNFSKDSIIADIGSGTGKLTQLFIKNGNTTYAVEPNANMRDFADKLFKKYRHYISVNGTAENTTLENKSMDFVTVAQAFHWFDPQKSITEFKRILKEKGVLVLIWNVRKIDTVFLNEYEKIISTYSENYKETWHRNTDDDMMKGCFKNEYEKIVIAHSQRFNFEEVIGRYLSSSYSAKEGTERYIKIYDELKRVFELYKEDDNKIRFNYDMEIYAGNI